MADRSHDGGDSIDVRVGVLFPCRNDCMLAPGARAPCLDEPAPETLCNKIHLADGYRISASRLDCTRLDDDFASGCLKLSRPRRECSFIVVELALIEGGYNKPKEVLDSSRYRPHDPSIRYTPRHRRGVISMKRWSRAMIHHKGQ